MKEHNGRTSLHFLVCKCSTKAPSNPIKAIKAAEFLLRRGTDETLTDKDGHTTKDLTETNAATQNLKTLWTYAPADRAWRRQAMVVLRHAHSAEVSGGVGGGRVSKVPC